MRLSLVGYLTLTISAIGLFVLLARVPKLVRQQRIQSELAGQPTGGRAHLANLAGGASGLMVLTFFFWMLDGFTYLDACLVTHDWAETTCVVTGVKNQGRSNPDRYDFEFQVDGATYSASSYSRQSLDKTNARVKYDRYRPHTAYLVGSSRFQCLPLWCLGFGVMMVFVFLALMVCVGHVILP